MQTLSQDTPTRLVFRVRSPLQNAVGGLGLFFLLWLIVHWLTRHPNHERTIGLIGASITCLLFLLASETGDFVFDSGSRCLTWSRRIAFIRRSGKVPFAEIEQVVVRSALGSDAVAPSQRIVLLTRSGELPLTISYSPSDAHAENAARLRTFLGRTSVDPVSASVADLVAAGRDLDAIRELRLARGLSLADAHAEVARLRKQNSTESKHRHPKETAMKFLLVLLLLFPLTGCIATYRDFPAAALDHPASPGNCEVLNYQINRFNVLDAGGFNQLQDLFAEGRLCRKTVQADQVPEKGLYVVVETEWRPMSLPALAFGYISLSTLTLLPAWSTQDGYVVNYHLYVDGKEQETYRYKITRKAGLWIGLLPLVWVNAFTYREVDAFTATVNQFARDARPYLDRKPPATTSD